MKIYTMFYNLLFNFLSIVNNKEDIANRICAACLPFLDYYEPFHQRTVTASFAIESYKNIVSFKREPSSYHAAMAIGNISLGILSRVNYKLAKGFSCGLHAALSLKKIYTHITNRKYKKASKAFCLAVTHGLKFALFIHPASLDLQAISLSLKILSKLDEAYSEWNKNHYIETVSNLALACIKGYEYLGLQQKWLLITNHFSDYIDQLPKPESVEGKRLDNIWNNDYLPFKQLLSEQEKQQNSAELSRIVQGYIAVMERIPFRNVTLTEIRMVTEALQLHFKQCKIGSSE